MGTVIALFLVLGVLTGCAGETMLNVKNALPDPAPEAISFSVEVEAYEETVRDEAGAVLVECAYQLPVMRAILEDGSVLKEASTQDQERALEKVEAFNARFDPWKANPQTLAGTARENRALGGWYVPYTDGLWCSVYQTESLVSVTGTYSSYTGGAHSNTLLVSWNFDLETGSFFEAEVLDEGGDFLDYVRQELVRQARQMGARPESGGPFWDDYEDTLAQWPSYAVSFNEAGMTVGFSPYELASYAAGPQVFRLTYDQLRPHLGAKARAFLGLPEE